MDTESSVGLSEAIEAPAERARAGGPVIAAGRTRRESSGGAAASAPVAARASGREPAEPGAVEVSVVMPCLNEADTLAVCIEKARRAMDEHCIAGEIIVADNGSTDGSPEIARRMGARVVPVTVKGYGSALMGGIAASRGTYIIMGDADDSYDFLEIPRFVGRLREGHELVQGCRLPWGGGTVKPGAMRWLHRWVGNPAFSLMVRWMFGATIHDVHCGLRGFTKAMYDGLDLRCTGMEFASEMITKATLFGADITEVPITLHPDGRKAHPPHLRTFRDGWRHLRFLLLFSPRWLFLIPGVFLMVLGLIGYGLALPGVRIFGMNLDVHTLLFASLFLLIGFQSILFAILAKSFAIGEGLMPEDPRLRRFFQVIPLERGLMIGAAGLAAGGALLLQSINQWRAVGFGDLNYEWTMRWVIPGVTLFILGFQTIMASFFASILGMRRR
jgi:glycosyltransferase involved in cell wall biosynthesis